MNKKELIVDIKKRAKEIMKFVLDDLKDDTVKELTELREWIKKEIKKIKEDSE